MLQTLKKPRKIPKKELRFDVKYKLTKDEIAFIESMIKPME